MHGEYADVVQLLGSGAFGTVTKVRRRSDGKELVCKTIIYDGTRMSVGAFTDGTSAKQRVEKECRMLRVLRHQHIVEYIDHIFEDNVSPPCCNLYMELCDYRDLDQYMATEFRARGAVPPKESIWDIMRQVSSALAFCHEGSTYKLGRVSYERDWKPVLHRDIKPANVFIAQRVHDSEQSHDKLFVKLGDFGLGAMMTDSRNLTTYAGTTIYIAPEITRGYSQWSPKSDIFSLGCLLYEYATLRQAFKWHIDSEEDLPAQPTGNCPEHLGILIMSCLSFSAESRPSASKLLINASKELKSLKYGTLKAPKAGLVHNFFDVLPNWTRDLVDQLKPSSTESPTLTRSANSSVDSWSLISMLYNKDKPIKSSLFILTIGFLVAPFFKWLASKTDVLFNLGLVIFVIWILLNMSNRNKTDSPLIQKPALKVAAEADSTPKKEPTLLAKMLSTSPAAKQNVSLPTKKKRWTLNLLTSKINPQKPKEEPVPTRASADMYLSISEEIKPITGIKRPSAAPKPRYSPNPSIATYDSIVRTGQSWP